MWRFHGNQLSVRQDSSHLGCLKAMFGRALPEIYQRHHSLLAHNDCAFSVGWKRLSVSFSCRSNAPSLLCEPSARLASCRTT